MGRLWQGGGFRSWPVWARLGIGAFVALFVLGLALGGGGGDDSASDDRGDEPAPAATTTTAESRCLTYPIPPAGTGASAEELARNPDTGFRRVEGSITKAAAVKSRERTLDEGPIPASRDKPLYFVSFNIGGGVVTLARPDRDNSGKPTGDGLYQAVDAFSETVTSFPYDEASPAQRILRASFDTDGAQESRDCVS